MKEKLIRKSYELPDAVFKYEGDDDPGTIEGFAASMGNMDSWGDVIIPGAFERSGAIEEFKRSGFVATGHDWSDNVGYPTECKEQGLKLYSKAKFHSDDDAQKVRTRCTERISAGLSVGLSIGFSIAKGGYAWFDNGEAMLKFLDESKMDLSGWDVKSIESYPYMCRAITDVKKLYEWSIVPVPANDKAEATNIKQFAQGSPLAGLTLEDALDQTLAVMDEVAGRLEAYKSLKDGENRQPSGDRVMQVRALHKRFDDWLKSLQSEESVPQNAKADELRARMLSLKTAALAARKP